MNPPVTGQSHEESEQLRILKRVDKSMMIMAVKLFGSSNSDHETADGRLPKVEKSVKAAHERIDKITLKLAWMMGVAAAILFLAEHFAHKLQ
jgi:hypothetical protein